MQRQGWEVGAGVGIVSLYHVNSFLQVELSLFPVLVHIFKRTFFSLEFETLGPFQLLVLAASFYGANRNSRLEWDEMPRVWVEREEST